MFYQLKIYISPIFHSLLNAWGDVFFLRYAKQFHGESIAYKAIFCRLTCWFTVYTSPRSLTNSLEEFFTVICLSLMRSDESYSYKKNDKQKPSTKNKPNYWIFHAVAFTSFVVRSTAAINLIPIYVYHFFYLCKHFSSKLRFIQQFLIMG
jgi:hypothetical protein